MNRKWTAFLLGIMLLLSLTGCGLKFGDDLYALPKTSVEYESLQTELQQLLDSGLEYAAPLTGSNIQPVQDVEIDGNAPGEALAIFRDNSNKEANLSLHLFRKNDDNAYVEMTVISGQGLAVNSVTFAQLDDTPNREIVVSWQISGGLYALSAYRVWDGGHEEIFSSQNYSRYSIVDLDRDGREELVLLHLDPSDAEKNRAEWYGLTDGGLGKVGETLLSNDLRTIERVKINSLSSGEPALYVTGYTVDPDTGETNLSLQLTDILAYRGGNLVNIPRNERTGNSTATMRRTYVAEQDLDKDGVLEIPVLNNVYERLDTGEVCMSENFYIITWIRYDLQGEISVAATTYYNSSDGWYLKIPEEWQNQIALSRQDFSEGNTIERNICFYYIQREDPSKGAQLQQGVDMPGMVLTNSRADLLFTITKNTGLDRVRRASQNGRTPIEGGGNDASYAVRVEENSFCDWTAETVSENMHIITTNWSSE